jgi:polysaccharide biosynthesis/export protein
MRLPLAMCAAAMLLGCSTVPNVGPTRQSVIRESKAPDQPYLLVPITDYIVEQLIAFPGPSLYGKFGDYRGAVEQRIGIGDQVSVAIFEAAAGGLFSQPVSTANTTGSHSATVPGQLVQQDGTITIPYAGQISVVGKTTYEVEKEIVDKLTGKAIEPQAIVSLTVPIASSITLSGESVRGGRIPLSTKGDRLLDVIAEAGGITTPANVTFLELTRGKKTVRVPFQTLLNSPKENIFARPGDTLTVVQYPLSFTAIGATNSNANITFDAMGISLEEAIAKAQGFADTKADPEGVFVFRYEPVEVARRYPGITPAQAALNLVPVVYLINMRDPGSILLARRFSMHDKDIVYISNSPLNDLQKVLQLASQISSPVVSVGELAVSLR